jgi:D-glycero-alpha-D-manno-heptose 1-phosphate guanylyltransferase
MEAVILAGGKGTRLQPLVNNLPKPMATITGIPFLKYLLKYLEQNKINTIIMSIGYMSDKIRHFFRDEFFGMQIKYSEEEIPLGTGGAIRKSLEICKAEDVFVINGDTFFDVNLFELQKFHKEQNADISISLKELENPSRYGTLEIKDGRIIAFKEKQQINRGYINGGIYCIKKDLFDKFKMPDKFSFETEFLSIFTDKLKMHGLQFYGNFIDIGIPEDYELAQTLIPSWIKL